MVNTKTILEDRENKIRKKRCLPEKTAGASSPELINKDLEDTWNIRAYLPERIFTGIADCTINIFHFSNIMYHIPYKRAF
jgi:hypothetical protein